MEVDSLVGGNPKGLSRSECELELSKQNDEADQVMDAIFPNWCISSSSVSITGGVLPSLGHCLPWVYIMNPTFVGHRRINAGTVKFANIETRQTFLVDVHALLGTNLLYSKGGWVLLKSRPHRPIVASRGRNLATNNYFLVNATSGARLELPTMLETADPRAAFTLTSDGVPDLVLYAHIHNLEELIVCLARPGDSKWIERTTTYCHRQTGRVEGLIISGGMAYFFLQSRTYVLGLDDFEWKECFQFGSNGRKFSMLECEGKIVMISSAFGNCAPGPFYRVERTGEQKLEMVQMCDDELEGRVWFLNGVHQSFCVRVKGKGQKVCCFMSTRFTGGFAYTAHCYDLVRGTCARFTSPSDIITYQRGKWIDLCTCGSPNHADLSHLGITDDDLFPGF